MRHVLHALSLALAAPLPLATQERAPAPVTARVVEARAVTARERVTGSLRAASEAELAAREDGPVARVDVREGDVVRAGDVLLTLDTRRLEASRAATLATRAEADATRVQREAEHADAREDLGSIEAAARTDAMSPRELRRARTAVLVAEAAAAAAARRVEALDAELNLLAVRLEDATLRAPFDGAVVARHVEAGEWVTAGDPLVTLVSAGALEVWLDVPERLFAGAGGLGELALELSGDGAVARAVAPRRVPRVDPRSRSFPLVATVPHDADAPPLSAGMAVSTWVAVGEPREALLVPKDALVHRPGGVGVLVIVGEGAGGAAQVKGTAAFVPVVVSFEVDREVAVEPGAVSSGALVVTEGNERLFPGTPVLATVDRAPLAPRTGR